MIEAKRQAKGVIVEVVRLATKGERLLTKARLMKAFHLAHVCYAKQNQGALTAWPIQRILNREDVTALTELKNELIKDGFLAESGSVVFPFVAARYVSPMPESKRHAIVAAIDAVHHLSSPCNGKFR